MASDEHKKLADFIKSTHNQLRKESRLYGPMEAWERHLARTELLKDYATTMRELATNHWREQIAEKNGATHCRNEWIRSQCYDYFFNGGKDKFMEKEGKIRNKIIGIVNSQNSIERVVSEERANSSSAAEAKIKLLDVGSCYNPLGAIDIFDVTPIDIAPSTDKVLQCDFLNVKLGMEAILSADQKCIRTLKESSFDVVLFSLLLEYFPCPEQRFDCCKKAYDLLVTRGILIIITPDSNHIGANANIMKSWRLVLSRLGFMRINYEKLPHLHCLAFGKCSDKSIAARWSEIQIVPENDTFLSSENKIYIPQDFSTSARCDKTENKIVYDPDELAAGFDELPCVCDTLE